MHELSIASAIVERAAEVAQAHGGGAVSAVTVRVGELSGVVADALAFSFEVVREGTPLAAARLLVEEVPARAHCGPCGTAFDVGCPPLFWCPRCDRAAPELLSGRELDITGVELADPADPRPADTAPAPPPPEPAASATKGGPPRP
ncbi:hydrogenase maturation nickel metallochaperone HypA [Streptomyces sp. CC228A]|uniref:hydrogenase maturation nickel metallochaperone HypA/HybF n=1 Tax=Streptomyces sp. CC228A TaxID=2898186 RepID=UPI001F285D3F|nr:hydrogenase maturation nickel metallochaperone HypA [Streptomyces sp. CC228A]